jgi:ankyrin repeat protein
VDSITFRITRGTSRHAIAHMFIKRGADLKALTNYWFTPLHFASREGQVDIARMLIEAAQI